MWILYGVPPGQRAKKAISKGAIDSLRAERAYRARTGWTALSIQRLTK